MTYQPSRKILDKYADVIINCALNSGKGIKKGDVVFLQVPECAKPILLSLQKAVLRAGGNFLTQYLPDNISREFYELGSEKQIAFFPAKYMKARVETIDHSVFIEADVNPHELEGINPKKIMMRQKSFKPYMDWRHEKENKGEFTWVLALYGTKAMAKEAKMSAREYWKQIIKACFLNDRKPVKKWKETLREIESFRTKLSKLPIEKLHIKSKNTDLTIGIGKNREWMVGSGRNVPSFEVFISPDCRVAEGYIFCDQPLYRYGVLVKDIYLEFKDGRIVKVKAKKGEKVLKEMIAQKNADRLGEYSLTDKRFSKINKFMATTLFDENYGGKWGNTHVAFGRAYTDSYPGNPAKVSKKQWEKMGYNDSVVHTDVISTENRVVTATLFNGEKKVIYRNGKFVI